ncbi:hypothetical protein WT97_03005 [Burkholderia sp. MSMB1459WGS]|uniref:hypothetical protein n=1 Tax=Burkholderia sp. MSMB1459WGS TaxID=1637970 RepID=UPI00075FD71A|nr:hypothetical protein [Burkholderia sp. MSMB1459WGS]KWO49715.1 hypothetical protein WT97_03005 [Burkholderia sp. MSMB1459WGS]
MATSPVDIASATRRFHDPHFEWMAAKPPFMRRSNATLILTRMASLSAWSDWMTRALTVSSPDMMPATIVAIRQGAD